MLLGCGGGAPDPREADLIAARAVAAHGNPGRRERRGKHQLPLFQQEHGCQPDHRSGQHRPLHGDVRRPAQGKGGRSRARRKARLPAPQGRKVPAGVPGGRSMGRAPRAREEEPERTSMRKPQQPKTPAPKKEKEPEAKQDLALPEEDPADYEDVTQRVLTGDPQGPGTFLPEALSRSPAGREVVPGRAAHGRRPRLGRKHPLHDEPGRNGQAPMVGSLAPQSGHALRGQYAGEDPHPRRPRFAFPAAHPVPYAPAPGSRRPARGRQPALPRSLL